MDWTRCLHTFDRRFRAHALVRMDQRGISFEEFDEATGDLTILQEYEEDQSYPSCLALGFSRNGKPVHIVTVYEPKADRWTERYTRRIK